MWQSMLVEQIPLLEKILRTVVVYLLIIVLFRVVGKRNMAAMNTLDFVVLFLLSNVVQNAIIGPDQSLVGGVAGAVILVGLDSLVNRVNSKIADRYPAMARLLDGKSTTVIRDGRIIDSAVRRLGIRGGELDHAVRTQHGDDVSEVEKGELDANGHLILSLKSGEQSATKADIAELRDQLTRVEALLSRR